MRKSFALCEAFGLTPFPSPWIPPFQDAARSAREGLSAGKLPPTQPSVAERPSAHLHCAARSAAQVLLRAAARGQGVGVKASPIRQAPRGAAMKVQVESSPDGIPLRARGFLVTQPEDGMCLSGRAGRLARESAFSPTKSLSSGSVRRKIEGPEVRACP